MALASGSRLGPYEVTSQIGVGGMGEVYRAIDTSLGRRVAIKVLPESFATDPDRLARFEREAKTLAALNHPNIAQINPVNPMPHKTRFHELAHVLLGHTAEGIHADGELTPLNLRECEAEALALLCCAALELPGVEHCRGYIQSWWGANNPIPERSAQRVLKVADQILKAGTIQTEALS